MKTKKKEFVCKDLKLRVLTLDLPPGQQLDEVLLSDQYELSRTPLSEVLQRIAGEGRTVALTVDHWELSRVEMDRYVMPDSLPMNGIEEISQRRKHEI